MVESSKPCFFRNISSCCPDNRDTHTVVADLEGSLLRRNHHSLLRSRCLRDRRSPPSPSPSTTHPLAFLLRNLVSESAGVRVLVFASLAGVKLSSINSVARAVLPKFYASEVRADAWRVFSACGRRWVVTAIPRVMVEPFAKEYLGADVVVGSELGVYKGRTTGLVVGPGVVAGDVKEAALRKMLGDSTVPEIGIGHRKSYSLLSALCKEAYVVSEKLETEEFVGGGHLLRPIVFHDGRLVQKPTPLRALLTVVWFPIGFLLACLRIAAGSLLPMPFVSPVLRLLGVRIIVKGNPPSASSSGVLFVCSHRTLLDPIFLSAALRRPVPALTYSVSRLSELLSPITTIRLSRNRSTDAATIRRLLATGDLAICPEGTTCREPFLLRFSSLFAELTDDIVPVAMENRMGMFHGTTARGWKGMDPFYFFMNPSPAYKVTFLEKLPKALTCGAGRPSYEVANDVQRLIAGFSPTSAQI
ncbi:hypothetical protein HPP92_019932 [Vanilla planifolia]|uniref:Phospholipid/glycerol acyltransferase domain-containing protein n=1 Tax=Vanilla planifolia TaxID=51239 RepID=A0A835QB96_VANPL|nr:hypothetical protein HPP92_019932 [Vanilla planifolia]